jgi:hypothetical protein
MASIVKANHLFQERAMELKELDVLEVTFAIAGIGRQQLVSHPNPHAG